MTSARAWVFLALIPAAAAVFGQPHADDLKIAGGPPAAPAPASRRAEPDDAALAKLFDRETTLATLAPGKEQAALRRFLWRFLDPAERSAVESAPASGSRASALLAGADQFRYDLSVRYPKPLQALIRSSLGLPAQAFNSAGELVPTTEVTRAQDRIAKLAFSFQTGSGVDLLAPRPAPAVARSAMPETETDRKLAGERERMATIAPLLLDAATRAKIAAARADPACVEKLARAERMRAAATGRPAIPLPGAAEIQRRLTWARGVLEGAGFLDREGVSGWLLPGRADPLVLRALDTFERYALSGEPSLPNFHFPRTRNRVRLLFGFSAPELHAVYDQVQAMMDRAKKTIWVDLYFLGGTLDEPAATANLGVRFVRYLQERKRQGVEIRFLISPKGTEWCDPNTYDAVVATLGARPYNIAALPGGLPTKVDHDKLIVIDHGAEAMVATMNFDASGEGKRGHHETVSILRGPAAAALAWTHLSNWRLAGGSEAAGDVAAIRRQMATEPSPAREDEADADVRLTTTQPLEQNTRERLLDWIDTTPAGETLRVWMFQFGDNQVEEALVRAARRGVIVRMLVDPCSGPIGLLPQFPNLPAVLKVQTAIDAAFGSKGGVKLLDRDLMDRFLHTKVAVFGNDRFTQGSTNWTVVGLERNAELSVWIDSRPLAAKLIERFERDWIATKDGRAVFPDFAAYRALYPSYMRWGKEFLDSVDREMDDFF